MNAEVKGYALSVYYRELRRIGLLSAGEERKADVALLVKANLRLVVHMACRFRDCGLELEELIAEGNVGLLEAARRFDAAVGVRFVSYAGYWIRKRILSALHTERALQWERLEFPEELVDEDVRRVDLDLEEMLAKLSDRQQLVLCWSFGLRDDGNPLNNRLIGERLGVSAQAVQKLRNRALQCCRRAV